MVVKTEMVQTGTKRDGEVCTAFLSSLVILSLFYIVLTLWIPWKMDLSYAW